MHAKLQRIENQTARVLADVKAKLVEAKDASDGVWRQNAKPALDAAVQKAQDVYEDTAAWSAAIGAADAAMFNPVWSG